MTKGNVRSDNERNDRTSANWKTVDILLRDYCKANVLAILDTCFASNLYKHQQADNPRTYELFCASGYDKATAGPGPKSFTTALIGALEELLKKYGGGHFTTRELSIEVGRRKERRLTQPFVWPILYQFESYIALAPRKPATLGQKEEYNQDQVRATLTLRLPLTVERLTEQQIIKLARGFCQAVKKVKAPVKRVHWGKLETLGERITLKKVQKVGRVLMSAAHWRKLSSGGKPPTLPTTLDQMEQNMNDSDVAIEQSPANDSALSMPSAEVPHLARPSHKRKHNERHNSVEGSAAKRRTPKNPEESP